MRTDVHFDNEIWLWYTSSSKGYQTRHLITICGHYCFLNRKPIIDVEFITNSF